MSAQSAFVRVPRRLNTTERDLQFSILSQLYGSVPTSIEECPRRLTATQKDLLWNIYLQLYNGGVFSSIYDADQDGKIDSAALPDIIDASIRVRRGTQAALDLIVLLDGELGWTTDTERLYVGQSGVNVFIGPGSAAGGGIERVMTANYVTTLADASDVGWLFTPVVLTAGKSYLIEVEAWVSWQTGLASGSADFHNTASLGPLVLSDSLCENYYWAIGGSDYQTTSFHGGLFLSQDNPSTTPTPFRSRGVFKADNSEEFNIGVNVGGWTFGDAVTVHRGSYFRLKQID